MRGMDQLQRIIGGVEQLQLTFEIETASAHPREIASLKALLLERAASGAVVQRIQESVAARGVLTKELSGMKGHLVLGGVTESRKTVTPRPGTDTMDLMVPAPVASAGNGSAAEVTRIMSVGATVGPVAVGVVMAAMLIWIGWRCRRRAAVDSAIETHHVPTAGEVSTEAVSKSKMYDG